MEMPKPTEQDKAAFRALVPTAPGVEVRPMFGNLAAFVNGNMFMGLFGSSVGVKLSEEDRTSLLEVAGAGSFGPLERPMAAYVSLPEQWLDGRLEARDWVERALAHVAALPPKQPRKR